MSWFLGTGRHSFRRRRYLIESRRTMLPPVFEHPCLELGGQSIELSLLVGRPVSPDALVLAVERLHELVRAAASDGVDAHELEEHREAALFLVDVAADMEIPASVRAMLTADAHLLAPLV